jgi:hypothetical protein
MSNELARHQTPEQAELEEKQKLLDSLAAELSDRELELATLKGELGAFENEYVQRVVAKYAILDDLNAQIAEWLAERCPEDVESQESASQAREQANESAGASGDVDPDLPMEPFEPTQFMKDLFKKLATKFHPDKGDTPEQRARFEEIFKEINRAYQDGDEGRMMELERELANSPDEVTGESIAEQLVRAIRKVAQIRRRIDAIAVVVADMNESEFYQLRETVREAEQSGRDLFAEMAAAVDAEIETARTRLSALTA